MRRSRPFAALVVGVLAVVAPACSDDGDRAAYCERIASIPDVEEILASLDTSDPGGLESSIEEAVEEFRALERDAPGSIRGDVARLREGVELVLEAVQDNPGDLPATREAILDRTDELAGLARAGTRVATDAQAECDLALE